MTLHTWVLVMPIAIVQARPSLDVSSADVYLPGIWSSEAVLMPVMQRGFAEDASAEFTAMESSVSEAQAAADTAQKEAESMQASKAWLCWSVCLLLGTCLLRRATNSSRSLSRHGHWLPLAYGRRAITGTVAVAASDHKSAGLQAQYLRLNADFENFRRRAATEKDATSTRVKAKTVEARFSHTLHLQQRQTERVDSRRKHAM